MQKRSIFIAIVQFLRMCLVLGMAVPVVFLMSTLVTVLLGKTSVSLNLMESDVLKRPLIKIPITVNFRDYPDTTISFINPKYPEMGTDQYYSRENLNTVGRIYYPDAYQIHNQQILSKYRKGLYQSVDTTIYRVFATHEPKGVNELMPFNFSKPKQVSGELLAEPLERANYWWVRWLNTLSVLLKGIVMGWVLWLLWKLLGEFEKYKIFSQSNFKNVRNIGIAMLMGSISPILEQLPYKLIFEWNKPNFFLNIEHSDLEHLGQWMYLTRQPPTYYFTLIPIDSPFFIGLTIIVLAEIFRYGLKLQQDQELTI